MNLFWLVVIGVIVYAVYQSAYASGKRIGSRKAYGIGYARGKRQRSQNSGCLTVIVLVLAVAGNVAATVLG